MRHEIEPEADRIDVPGDEAHWQAMKKKRRAEFTCASRALKRRAPIKWRVARGIATRPEGPYTVPRSPGGDRLGGRPRPEESEAASATDMGTVPRSSKRAGVTPP